MEPILAWLDLTASDRDKMRKVLDLFKDQGTIDEMGLGSLRDTLSEALFPGTSTIHTRLRYLLFVPWIYLQLENRRISSEEITDRARQAEIDLIAPLQHSNDNEGTIGMRARGSLVRLPSSVYWTAFVKWNIFQHEQSQSWYHTHFTELAYGRDSGARADDPGVVWTRKPNWHPRLPKPPKSFPSEASFKLKREEADFLQGRLEEQCAGTLLAWLAREGLDDSSVGYFWDEYAVSEASIKIRDMVELARRFSLHVEGIPLLYNLMLAERRHKLQGGDDELVEQYQVELAEWASRETEEEKYNPNILWDFVSSYSTSLGARQYIFVESWSKRIAEISLYAIADDIQLRDLIENREHNIKGTRARLNNQGRLLDWNGRAGVGRMDFRWHRVRQLLIDLFVGLAA